MAYPTDPIYKFVKDSIVLDPHRYISSDNIILKQIGNNV